MANANTSPAEICKALFGEYPEDVITPIKSASEVFGWVEELFTIIARESNDGGRVKRMAEMGAYLAADWGNAACCQHETLADNLRAAGSRARVGGAS